MSVGDTNWSAKLVQGSGGGVGYVMCPDATGALYVPATTAALATAKRKSGVQITPSDSNGIFTIQYTGELPNSVTGLGPGTATSVIIGATGTLVRSAGALLTTDYYMGDCSADGSMTLQAASNSNPSVAASLTPGTAGQVLVTVAGPLTSWVTPAGDWTGAVGANVVGRINGATVPAAGALTIGQLLQVSGVSALAYAALNLALAASVTGLLPAGNQAAQTMAGDVTGTTAVSVVARANGATIPASGALTTGNVLQVTGVSALSYAPINLQGGANFVINKLPAANQSDQAMAGDVTGITSVSVVARVNGATVPAAGALTTGNAAYVSGVSALTYSALNLAGGAGWVTGVLPAGNMASLAGDVTGAINASVVVQLTGSSGVVNVVGTAVMTFGASPATAGTIRLPQVSSIYQNDGGANRALINATAGQVLFGDTLTTNTYFQGGNAYLSAGTYYVGITGGGSLNTNCVNASYSNSIGSGWGLQFSPVWNGATALNFGASVTSAAIGQIAAAASVGAAMLIAAQDGGGAGNGGGTLTLRGGLRVTTGLRGGVAIAMNGSSTEIMAQAVEVVSGNRVFALCRLAALTSTQMPANTGDGVIYIGNATTASTANPVSGGILYAEAGALKWRGTSGTTTVIAVA